MVHRIAPRAVLLVAVEDDTFTFADHAAAPYEKAGAPKKLLHQGGFMIIRRENTRDHH